MYIFDEVALARSLEALPDQAKIAFAAAAATRQLGSYERLARLKTEPAQRPREIAVQLWDDLSAVAFNRISWSARLDEVMGLLPEESDDWTVVHALAEDALSSLAYAIRCLLTLDPQEATWAGRRAYEAADQAAIHVLGDRLGMPQSEDLINSHRLVQRELERQRNDLAMLHGGALNEVRERAFSNESLTNEEASSF